MRSLSKWLTMIMIAVAMIILFYHTGVISSKFTVGLALTTIGASLFLFILVVPPPEDE